VTQANRIIVGLGTTGLSCARYLHSLGESFQVVDSRLDPPGLAELKAQFPTLQPTLGEFSAALLSQASELIVSPGISIKTPAIAAARKAGVAISGDIDIFSKAVHNPVVAVTGSNGKSTVVTLLAAMARKAGLSVGLGGNLDGAQAAPALDLLLQDEKDLYVLELSSFQLETTQCLAARAAVILNVSDDHMDRYENKQEYAAAKQRIFTGATSVVVNRDEAASTPWSKNFDNVLGFGANLPGKGEWGVVERDGEVMLAFGDELVLSAQSLKIAGKHNISNALAALALGQAIDLPRQAMVEALQEFPGLPHRCQWLRNLRGVDYFNDSKGTNVGASIVAIESLGEILKGKLIWIAGGVDKGADFSVMAPVVAKFVKLAILIGRDAKNLANACKDSVEIVFANTLLEAVNIAAARANTGDAVLLSPACASFDMFTGFAHRGRVFESAVEELQ
jgi:UDP-N-acetylmuramoylalanine--D-glutamate ligase